MPERGDDGSMLTRGATQISGLRNGQLWGWAQLVCLPRTALVGVSLASPSRGAWNFCHVDGRSVRPRSAGDRAGCFLRRRPLKRFGSLASSSISRARLHGGRRSEWLVELRAAEVMGNDGRRRLASSPAASHSFPHTPAPLPASWLQPWTRPVPKRRPPLPRRHQLFLPPTSECCSSCSGAEPHIAHSQRGYRTHRSCPRAH